jgi:hypothetical protein
LFPWSLFFNYYTSLSLIIHIFTLPIKLRAYTLYLFCTNQLRSYMCICTTVLPPPAVWRLLYYRCAEFLTVPDVVRSPYTDKHIKQSIIVSFFCIHILCCFDPIILLPLDVPYGVVLIGWESLTNFCIRHGLYNYILIFLIL